MSDLFLASSSVQVGCTTGRSVNQAEHLELLSLLGCAGHAFWGRGATGFSYALFGCMQDETLRREGLPACQAGKQCCTQMPEPSHMYLQ